MADRPPRTAGTKRAEKILLQKLSEGEGVDDATSDECGRDIEEEDVLHCLTHDLPEGKAAGPDRLPNEIYVKFASLLAPLLACYYNAGRRDKKFPSKFNEGMVTMLYKKGHRSEVRNYRPITLLNSDYKILTRILAKRMLNIVTQFVSKA